METGESVFPLKQDCEEYTALEEKVLIKETKQHFTRFGGFLFFLI